MPPRRTLNGERERTCHLVPIVTVVGPVLACQEMGGPHDPPKKRVANCGCVHGRQHQFAKDLLRPVHGHHFNCVVVELLPANDRVDEVRD